MSSKIFSLSSSNANSFMSLGKKDTVSVNKNRTGAGITRSGENPRDQRRPPLQPDILPEAPQPLMRVILQR